MSIKSIVKKLFGYSTRDVFFGKEKKENYPKALSELVKFYPELENDRLIMNDKYKRYEPISEIKKIIDGYDVVNFDVENCADEQVKNPYPSECLSSGDTHKFKPFPECIKRINLLGFGSFLNKYPSTVGSSAARQDLVDYLEKEGFDVKNKEYYNGIGVHNVAFSISTTQAFNSILRVIAREGDVIIMAAPNYGIFATIAERQGVHVELVELKEENNYFLDPKDLEKKIISINNNLKKEKKSLDYTPKVVAYVNINPNNPIGNVMTEDDISLITEIADVCLDNGVFIIDDLIYRDLTYNQSKLAFPIGSIPKYFNNTISLFGLSKAYGLAGFRAGFVVMPTPIYWGYASEVFDYVSSMPLLQVEAVRAAFNGTKKRYVVAERYFKKLISRYLYQLDLVNVLIDGIDSIDEKNKRRIIKDINHYTKDKEITSKILKGIDLISIRKNTYPSSGFFIVVDFTKLKGKVYKDKKIETEQDLLRLLFRYGRVKYLMGENLAWPKKDEFVGRINFAIDKYALIHYFYQINKFMGELDSE